MDVARYKRLFLTEAADHLRNLDRGLVALEHDPTDRAVIDEVFRSAHSLKGMAGAMRYEQIQAIAHQMEDALDSTRVRGRMPPEHAGPLLEGVDAMRACLEAIDRGEPVTADLTDLQARLSGLVEQDPGPESETETADPLAAVPASSEESAGQLTWRVIAEVAGSSSTPSVRAFIVYRKVAALGQVFNVTPPLETIRSGDFRGALRLEVKTVVSRAELEQVLGSIPELESHSVELLESRMEEAVERGGPAPPIPEAPVPLPVPPRAPDPLRSKGVSTTVRVRAAILDRFMDSLSDLLLAKAHLQESGRRLGDRQLKEGLDLLERAVREVHDRVMEVRLLPLTTLTDRLPRLVRDLAVRRGKRIRLEIRGADVEVDRAVIEALDAPMVHLLRNAVDHGIESPERRTDLGKPADGVIQVSAYRDRGEVVIEVSDDGSGIDSAALRDAAVARNLAEPEQVGSMSEAEALQLIYLPGLTTSRAVSELSGRGVGMDAVKATVESLGGSLEFSSEFGAGTRFAMRLPVTVAVLNVLSVRAEGQLYAFPVAKVQRAVLATGQSLLYEGGGVFYVQGVDAPVPIIPLGALLGTGSHNPMHAPLPLVIVEAEQGLVALAVDGFQGQREVVLRPLGRLLERIEGLSGIALFSDGRPAFLLDAPKLCRGWS